MRHRDLHLNSIFSKMITLRCWWLLHLVRICIYRSDKTWFCDLQFIFVEIENDCAIGDCTIQINARKCKHIVRCKTKCIRLCSINNRSSEFVALFCSKNIGVNRATVAMTMVQRIKFSRSFHFTVQMRLVGDLNGHGLIHNYLFAFDDVKRCSICTSETKIFFFCRFYGS